MLPVAVSSMFFHEYPTPDIFRYVSRAGLDGIEYWLETPHFWLRGLPVREVLDCRKCHPGLRFLNVHAPVLDLNPCSINPEVAAVSVESAVRSIAIATELGASVLTLHPGRRTAKRPPGPADFARFDRYITAVREAAGKADVTICMENMEPAVNSLLCTPERARELLDTEPWLFFTLDIAHSLVTSDQEPIRFIEICGDRLKNVHLSRRDTKNHLPLDEDALMASVIHALEESGYTGPLTLEIDDLTLPGPLSADGKVSLLSRDLAFIRRCLA